MKTLFVDNGSLTSHRVTFYWFMIIDQQKIFRFAKYQVSKPNAYINKNFAPQKTWHDVIPTTVVYTMVPTFWVPSEFQIDKLVQMCLPLIHKSKVEETMVWTTPVEKIIPTYVFCKIMS